MVRRRHSHTRGRVLACAVCVRIFACMCMCIYSVFVVIVTVITIVFSLVISYTKCHLSFFSMPYKKDIGRDVCGIYNAACNI